MDSGLGAGGVAVIPSSAGDPEPFIKIVDWLTQHRAIRTGDDCPELADRVTSEPGAVPQS